MADFNIGIDTNGKTLPYSSEEVRKIVNKMMDGGNIIAVILVDKEGQVGVQVFGPPSKELADILEAATRAYKKAIRGH